MAELSLEVSRREDGGKNVARRYRASGKVPAVVYGGHRDPVAITVDRKTVSELIQKSEHGVRSIFLLKMTGTDQQRHAMIKDIQIDPISRRMTHIDFVRVAMDETAAEPGSLTAAVADAVCLKVSRCGGISGLLAQAALVRASGADVYLSSTFDGPLGIAAAVHCAAALRPTAACGLGTLQLFADELAILPVRDGAIAVPDAPGLGV